MKRINILNFVFLALIGTSLITLASCGGGGGAAPPSGPTVTSVKDANGNEVATSGTTGVFPTQIKISFSEAMDDSTIVTAAASLNAKADDASGNITVACGDFPPEDLVITKSETEDYTYIIVPADDDTIWMGALLECVLTVSTNVRNASGTPLAEAAVYNFTNACAVSDDFNADSSSCWSLGQNMSWNNWDDILANVLTFNTTNSSLDFQYAGLAYILIYKDAVVDSSGAFEIVLRFDTVSPNIPEGAVFTVGLSDSTDFAVIEDVVLAGVSEAGECFAGYVSGGVTMAKSEDQNCKDFDDVFVKLSATSLSSTITVQQSDDGINYYNFDTQTGTYPTSGDFLDSLENTYLVFRLMDNSGLVTQTDYINVSGISVSGQFQ